MAAQCSPRAGSPGFYCTERETEAQVRLSCPQSLSETPTLNPVTWEIPAPHQVPVSSSVTQSQRQCSLYLRPTQLISVQFLSGMGVLKELDSQTHCSLPVDTVPRLHPPKSVLLPQDSARLDFAHTSPRAPGLHLLSPVHQGTWVLGFCGSGQSPFSILVHTHRRFLRS